MNRRFWTWAIGMVAIWPVAAAWAEPVNYQMVTIGDVGNAPDPATGNLYGAVAYEYRIGKYDVTIGQYTAFLNAVAKTDTYGLYNTSMGTALHIAGISRSGSSGNYVYSVMNNGGNSANRPITYVSWFDAARFANWIANGQPTGAQSVMTTENGVYNLNGATSGDAPARNGTNPNTSAAPIYWVPTENEWYKAAYYQPASKGGPLDSYWTYATMSDTAPGNVIGSSANQANYIVLGYATGGQPYLTDVGAFTGSASFYGTFDQSGNVFQWNDLNSTSGSSRGVRGGGWSVNGAFYLSASFRYTVDPSSEHSDVGFRLAGVPVPEIDPAGMGSVLALVTGAVGLLERRRGRRA